jgi:hypothetical protein
MEPLAPLDPFLTKPVPGMAQAPPEEAERERVSKVDEFFTQARSDRRAHEIQWFLNAAFLRGQHYVQWNEAQAALELTPAAPHRIRLAINHVYAKNKMRQARFLQTRFEPLVVPASLDRQDKLDARATLGALKYISAKEGLEKKYRHALNWSCTTGRGYWWFYWDESKLGRVKLPAGTLGPQQLQEEVLELPLGDVCVEVGSPFEILVGDPGQPSLAEQTKVMRVKLRHVDDLRQRYPEHAERIKADAGPQEIFQYQRQIANLATRTYSGVSGAATHQGGPEKAQKDYVIVKELFERPTATFPKGRYTVVGGGVLLRAEDQLPYGFHDMANPFPVVEFPDTEFAGQYWVPTVVEQLMALNKEYNLIRSKAAEQIRLQAHPKIIVSALCKFPANAWTSEAGEVIRILTPPNVPPPMVIRPENIAADAWRHLDIIRQELDTIPNLYPTAAGNSAGTSSGFQVNLLQEATNSVHAPDIRNHEMAWEEAMYKLRRMMKQYYDVSRMIAVRGKNSAPEVFEFSQNNIDEHAEIRIFTGNALSSSPAVRTKQVMELFATGMLGPQADPKTAAKGLKVIDLDGVGELQDDIRRDEEQASLENTKFERGAQFQELPPQPWDNHELHWEVHTALFKSPEFEAWDLAQKRQAILHAVYHAKYVNPTHAYNLAMELDLQELMPMLAPLVAPPQAPQGPEQGPPPGQAPPPPGPTDQAAPPAA